jgi:hypothetical protein
MYSRMRVARQSRIELRALESGNGRALTGVASRM